LIISIFLGFLGLIFLIGGIIDPIVSMAICGGVMIICSVLLFISTYKKIPKINRHKHKYENTSPIDAIVVEPSAIDDIFSPPHLPVIENNTPVNFDNLSGAEFEEWCANLLRNNGFTNVQVTKTSGDQGVDILAQKSDIKYAIQCKCYSSNLGNSPVQEVHAGKSMYDCHVGVVMTNRHFTSGAKELAKATGVLLWDREKLLQMMSNAETGVSSYAHTNTDDKFFDAVELAIDAGKISTSLLQRRLEVGYGRAAKIIDEMEKLGFVSAPNGNVPRKILISREDFENLFSDR
jgi:predicted RecB family endonuclease